MRDEKVRLEASRRLSESMACEGDLQYLVEGVRRQVRGQVRDRGLWQDGPVQVVIEVRAWVDASH